MHNMKKLFNQILILALLFISYQVNADNNINMAEVRALAKIPVDEILKDSEIETIKIQSYWKSVHNRSKPLVVFFYSNKHGPSQRLATLIKYVAANYHNRLIFSRVKVSEEGKPRKNEAKTLMTLYSVDDIPGILFYDNVGTEMVLEDEDYIDADFKEFRTPKMFLWKTYFNAVRKELDKLLAD